MRRSLVAAVALTLAAPMPAAAGVHVSVGIGAHHGHHRGYYGGHYRPYYRSYYQPYAYRPYYYRPYYGWSYYYAPAAYYSPRPVLVSAARTPLPAAVEVGVKPKKAQVLLDGTPVGQARDFNGPWDLLYLTPGEHTLEFGLPGYQTLQLRLAVESGGYYRIAERLAEGPGIDPRSDAITVDEPPGESPPRPPEPKPAGLRPGRLYIEASPPDATVYLDDEFLARADELARLHGAIPVAQGEHTVEVVRPGFESRSVTFVVTDEPERVSVELRRDE